MLAVFTVFTVVFVVYVHTEIKFGKANDLRFKSHYLADELRQSSDDLTRMARTYVITGDPVFKKYYMEILDIREGRSPYPGEYGGIYWDIVLADDQHPRPDAGQSIALLQKIRENGFTEEEFLKFKQAKINSDALTGIELSAMKLTESAGRNDSSGRLKAIMMLHDKSYHQAKAAIMKPIDELTRMSDKRTLDTVHRYEAAIIRLRTVFIILGLLLIFMLRRIYMSLHGILGGTVDSLYAGITHLGRGEESSAIPVTPGMENSVMGWLSETQIKLARIDEEQKSARVKIMSLLGEKELILKEVHHRIKNNMNTIMNLLKLQADGLSEPAAVAALEDAGNRVQSMMVLYDKLYQSGNIDGISAKEYITALVDQIILNLPNYGFVRIEKQIDDFILDINILSSLGIIINELLSNIMKYAFKGRSDGLITLSSSLIGDSYYIVIQDNGIGMPESVSFENSPGFGMHMVSMLAGQIGADIWIERGRGTKFVLKFNI